MVKRILKHPHPILFKKCEPISEFNQEVREMVLDLEETLKANMNQAVGLAAPQIGFPYRIIAFVDLNDGNVVSLVNPQITYFSRDEMVTQMESCLSHPGKRRKIARAKEIVVEGFSMSGVPVKYSVEDYQARIVQHECDHLEGRCKVVSMR